MRIVHGAIDTVVRMFVDNCITHYELDNGKFCLCIELDARSECV
jgi:hypothetical protein